MKLLIDIGNTSSKLAVAHGGEMVHTGRLAEPWTDALHRLFATYDIERIGVACVGSEGPALRAALAEVGPAAPHLCGPALWLSASTPCPIAGIPEGYGADRLAADIGAYTGQRTLLVVDAGTCITYDLIVDGRLAGGVISPGVQLRLNAMHDYTAALPHIAAAPDAPLPPLMGHDTPSCMLSAAIHGVRHEMEGYIRALHSQHPDLEVALTGGNRFDLRLPDAIAAHYHPHLVLQGLAKLL